MKFCALINNRLIRNKFIKKKLKVFSSNLCGWFSKKKSLTEIIEREGRDIACLTETHTKGYEKPNLEGFTSYFRNRTGDRNGGGVCLLIKKNLELETIKICEGAEGEFVCVKINNMKKPIVMVVQYGVHAREGTENMMLAMYYDQIHYIHSPLEY